MRCFSGSYALRVADQVIASGDYDFEVLNEGDYCLRIADQISIDSEQAVVNNYVLPMSHGFFGIVGAISINDPEIGKSLALAGGGYFSVGAISINDAKFDAHYLHYMVRGHATYFRIRHPRPHH